MLKKGKELFSKAHVDGLFERRLSLRNRILYILFLAWRFLFFSGPRITLRTLIKLLIDKKRCNAIFLYVWHTLPFQNMGGLPLNKSVALTMTPSLLRLFCRRKDSETVLFIIWEVESLRVYSRFFEPKVGDVVIDVGAHIGIYTLRAAKNVGMSGLVLAVEPHPNNYHFLVKNVKANKLEGNIVPVKVALADFDGGARLYLHPRQSISHSMLPLEGATMSIEIKVRTADSLVNELGLSRVDLIKIDVEGYELEVLKGAEESLKRASRVVVAAYHTPREVEAVSEFLALRGFQVSTMDSFVYGSKCRRN